jgi:hypothetical protein
MGISVIPAPSAASKTMFRTTLTSGTSYTVPAGVTYLNVTLVGGGGGGGGGSPSSGKNINDGVGGQIISSTLSATAGATINYEIGSGGSAVGGGSTGGSGGTTTFTGATSASGGAGGGSGTANGSSSLAGLNAGNFGRYAKNNGDGQTSGNGGSGAIYIEYWA